MLPDSVTLDVILDVLFDDIETANAKLAPHGLKAILDPKIPGAVSIVTLDTGNAVGSIAPTKAELNGFGEEMREAQQRDETENYDQVVRRFIRNYEGDETPKFDAEAAETREILDRIRVRKLKQEEPAPTMEEIHEEDARITSLIGRMGGKTVDSTSDSRTVNNVMRHEYRVLDDGEKLAVKRVKDAGLKFLELVDSIGSSRELSIAKTKIEEAVFWAVKHITK